MVSEIHKTSCYCCLKRKLEPKPVCYPFKFSYNLTQYPGFDTTDTIFKGTTQGLFGSNFAFIPSRVSEEKDIKDFHFSTNQVWSNLSLKKITM